jgi:ubiquinone/menaquinone biosynthesis C-methylase UbiE
MVSPDYSSFAGKYAQSRPGYPAELFHRLASLLEPRKVAWDCATGNGQAAVALVEHFDRVIATDVSAEQIRHAAQHPQIEYRVASAEESGLDDRSVDVATVASALHWFDLDCFYSEATRVIRPQGLLAAWTYHTGAPLGETGRRAHHPLALVPSRLEALGPRAQQTMETFSDKALDAGRSG